MRGVCAVLLLIAAVANATVFFEDTFSGSKLNKGWVHSTGFKKDSRAKFTLSSGDWSPDEDETQGLATSTDMKFHAISRALDKPFSNRDSDLVVQFTAKYEKNEYSFCGGGYLKLLPSSVDLDKFDGASPYHIMFGPDRCGYDVAKIHAIFNDGVTGNNLERKEEVKLEYAEKNEFTHLYTLVVKPDNTYTVYFDNEEKATGTLTDDYDFPGKTIPDPKDKKPKDWVDEAKIPDPEETKPEGYDDIPAQIPDPEATMPDDWDEEDDGEWEAPLIDNPEYQGEWKPTMIDNPEYEGEWKAKRIANPDYREDVYAFDDIGAIGFELWIVNSGTIFDNILITDSLEEAQAHAKKHWSSIVDEEKSVKEALDAEKKAAEEAAKKAAEEEAEDEEEEEEEDDEDEAEHDEL